MKSKVHKKVKGLKRDKNSTLMANQPCVRVKISTRINLSNVSTSHTHIITCLCVPGVSRARGSKSLSVFGSGGGATGEVRD